MKLLAAVLLATTSGPLLCAQRSGTGIVFRSKETSASSCPVGFSASRSGAITGLLASRSGEVRPGAGFHLSFAVLPGSKLGSAKVVVHAAGVGGRVMQAGGSLLPVQPEPAGEFTRSFDVGSADGPALTKADVWLTDAGVLEYAELVSLTFGDGSTWHRSRGHRCIAEPSPLMLVDLR